MTEPRATTEKAPPPSETARPRRRRLALLLVVILLVGMVVALTRSGSHPSLTGKARKLPVPANSETTTVLWTRDYTALVVTHAPFYAAPRSVPRTARAVDARTGARGPARPFHPPGAHATVWMSVESGFGPPAVSPDGRWMLFMCVAPGVAVHTHALSTESGLERSSPLAGMPQRLLWNRDSRDWVECSVLADGRGLHVFSHALSAAGGKPRPEGVLPGGQPIGLTPEGEILYRPGDPWASVDRLSLRSLAPRGGRAHAGATVRLPYRSAVRDAALSPRGDRIAWLLGHTTRPWCGDRVARILARWGIASHSRSIATLWVSQSDGSGMREIGGDADMWSWPTTVAWLSDGRHIRLGSPGGWYVVSVE